MAGTQTILTTFTISGREDVEGAMGIPAASIWMWVEGSHCFYVFYSLSPNSGGQVPTDHQAKAAVL